MTFSDQLVQLATHAVNAEFDAMHRRDTRLLASQRRRVTTLECQKQKLIDAYLADALAAEDLKLRQTKLQAELLAA